jgi:hypothetical protein
MLGADVVLISTSATTDPHHVSSTRVLVSDRHVNRDKSTRMNQLRLWTGEDTGKSCRKSRNGQD